MDIPSELTSRGVALHLRWLAASAGRAGYETTEALLSTNPFRDEFGIFNLPVGDHEVWVWTSNGAGATSRIDVAKAW